MVMKIKLFEAGTFNVIFRMVFYIRCISYSAIGNPFYHNLLYARVVLIFLSLITEWRTLYLFLYYNEVVSFSCWFITYCQVTYNALV